MKRITALLLALAMIFALAGCIREQGVPDTTAGTPDTGGPQGGETGDTSAPPTDSRDPSMPPDSGDGPDPVTPPTDVDPDAVKLGLMGDAAAMGAAGLYGGGTALVTGVTDPGKDLTSGALDAVIVPVDTAAKLYAATDGKVRIAAVTARGGWSVIERGNTVHDIWGLASKTVYAAQEYPGALKLFTYIAEQYGFIIGDTLKLESVPLSELAGHDLTLMPAVLAGVTRVRDADTHEALNVGEEWNAVTGSAFLPAACLLVRADMAEEDLTALKAALKASQETVSDNLDSVVALGLAASQEEAWASLECLEFMWLEGADSIREELADYFRVVVQIDPELIGGYIPDDDFYR